MEIAIVVVVAVILAAIFFFRKRPSAPPAGRDIVEPAPPRVEPPPAAPAKKQAPAPTPAARPEAEQAARAVEPEAVVPLAAPAEVSPPPPPSRQRRGAQVDVQGLRRGLAKSRAEQGFFGRLKSLFGQAREIDESITADIEEVLLTSDVGVTTTESILARLRDGMEKGDLKDPEKVWAALRDEARRILEVEGKAGPLVTDHKPTVVLMVGVNGAGKTTTIGKLATKLKADGKKVLIAAGDTFRAAAVQQLQIWGERVGCEVVTGKDGADPSSVIFDAIQKASEVGADIVLADTAGRLHTKSNLMAEMTKIARTAGKALSGAPHETLLVIDSTNGQNAIAQAKEFREALELTGIVLTKLDGTAKGGMVLGICDSLQVPVRYVGLGESAHDLHEFSPEAFVEALLGRENESNAA